MLGLPILHGFPAMVLFRHECNVKSLLGVVAISAAWTVAEIALWRSPTSIQAQVAQASSAVGLCFGSTVMSDTIRFCPAKAIMCTVQDSSDRHAGLREPAQFTRKSHAFLP